jgi:hypothetical protein
MRGSFKTRPDLFMPSKATTLDATRRTLEDLLLARGTDAIPIVPVASDDDLGGLSDFERRWAEARDWTPDQGAVLPVPDETGAIGKLFRLSRTSP